MEAEFEARFGVRAQWAIRCPGRVNLIGEHIDYHGYGVLPMALDAATNILIAPSASGDIRFENMNASFAPRTVALPSEWKGASPPGWTDYLLAGWRGAIDKFNLDQRPFYLMLDSSVPASAGLSSSSSLVCAAALAALTVATNGDPWSIVDKTGLAELCMSAEHLIGTAGGGMDQAAECLSVEGSALRISFSPLRSSLVSLPRDAVFVVADSRERKNKAASNEYNTRVVEGRVAVALLGRSLDLEGWMEMRRLIQVEEASGKSLEELLKEVEKLPDKLSVDEARGLLGDHMNALLTQDTKDLSSLVVRARARHVLSEAWRVSLFASACEKGDLTEMGRLMGESHHSCSVDYDCSTPTLDALVSSLEGAGAVGARLTGAGWGGCAVALFPASGFAAGDSLSALPILFHSKPSQGIEMRAL